MMKKIYTEPEIEVFLFSKQDQIKASSVIETTTTNQAVEDQLADALGSGNDFYWTDM